MNPKRFLASASVILLTIGILGVVGLFERISPLSFFHPPYWINWAHIAIGIFAFIVSRSENSRLQARVTLIPAILGLLLGISGLVFGSFIARRFTIPELADPSDHIAHLIVGLTALWSWRNRNV